METRTNWIRSTVRLVTAMALCLTPALGLAEPAPEEVEAGQCYLHSELTVERQLRRLSLDLRGHAPEYEEYAAVDGMSEVPEAQIDAFLDSDAFRLQMRRYHESILWANPKGVSTQQGNILGTSTLPGNVVVWHNNDVSFQLRYRGGNTAHICQNKPQSELGYHANGMPIAEDIGNGVAEGWVEVQPYWAPDTTIKVCAFSAQETLSVTVNEEQSGGQEVEYSCATRFGAGQNGCGCGPNLRWCVQSGSQTTIWDAMREQLLRLVDDYTDGTRKYSEMLTTKRAYYNGVMLHYRKFLAARPRDAYALNDYDPSDGAFPPDEQIDWTDPTWHPIERSGVHAGLLTLPAYTLRFQTNRGRANRFRIAFAGQYFQPPDVGDYLGCDPFSDDLSKRCICRKCHMALEPMAAYFGQIAEAGSRMLTSLPPVYKNESDCNRLSGPFSSRLCKRLYKEVQSEFDKDYTEWRLRALEYADSEHPSVQENFDVGPAGIAQWAIDGGFLARATVKNLFKFFYHREMLLDPTAATSETELLEELTAEFAAHDDFKRLAKRLITLPQYRRTP